LAVKKASFAVEQAKSKRAVLESFAKAKTLGKLNNRVTKVREDELSK